MAPLTWRDDFDAAGLAADWHWHAPVAGPTLSLAERPGFLRIHAPQREEGFDLWIHKDAAPRLFRPAPEGDWELEARFELTDVPPESNFHLGVAAFPSEKFYFAWGPFQGHDIWNMTAPQLFLEYPTHGRVLAAPMEGKAVTVALRKEGTRYTCRVKRGDAWTDAGQAELPFPPKFVGLFAKTYGNRPGVTVDVDYVQFTSLESRPAEPPAARVTVRADQPQHAIDPFVYGHFIEHMHRCIYGGMWAEILHNRKFVGRADERGVVEGWQAYGPAGGVTYAPDTRVVLNPAQSQRIRLEAGGPARGVAQGGIVLEAGRRYALRTALRQEGLTAPVRVALVAGGKELASRELMPGCDWTTATFELTSQADAAEGQIAITSAGPGTLWLGAVSLMPADNVHGWRRDVLEAIRELHPPLLRWPGGNFSSGYHWEDGLGDPDRRPVRWDHAWSGWEPNDVGTDEFLQFCAELGIVPYIAANAGTGTPAEAAAWVQYCNGAADTSQGARRAAHGHPAPYNVAVWGLGNEMYGNWQLGWLDPEKYAQKALEMARLMRAASPTPLRLVAVGVDGDGWDHWNRREVKLLGHAVDWQSVHYYESVDTADAPETQYLVVADSARRMDRFLGDTARVVAEANDSGKLLPLAFDEWNVWKGTARAETHYENDYDLADALWACSVFHALHRHGDRVTMANLAQLVNVLGALRTDQTRLVRTTLFEAFRLYGDHFGRRFVPVEVQAPEVVPGRPLLDVSATLDGDGRLHLAVVNWHPSQPAKLNVTLQGFEPAAEVAEARLHGASFRSANRLGQPAEVGVTVRRATWAELLAEPVPAHSATIWTLTRR
ncbi:MAG: hypothetical protein HYU66_24655 [Armatimonadetes bacterium]|nr:hypothetical protein [Armatimonadota bacterium]